MELNSSVAHSVAGPRRQIILTFVNRVRLDFARTWAAHVMRIGLTNFLVGATDSGALDGLMASKIPCFSMRTNLPDVEWDWGSPSFKALGQHKVELIHKALTWGLEVVITDTDALVLREPFAYMARWKGASFLTTSDCLGNTTGSDDGGLEDHGCLGQAMNIGYMYFNVSALPLVQQWLLTVRHNPRGTWDQASFNTLARIGMSHDPAGLSDRRLFWSYQGKVVGGILPLSLFAGGHTHFVSRLAWRQNLEPYSVHTTFQYGGAPGKRHRLREAMLWHDAPSYYEPAGGVLTYTADVPLGMVSSRAPSAHIELMLHQLRQLRAGLALAFLLGRKLVLPQLACALDKYWGPLNGKGVIPGAYEWALPNLACPLDHLLNPAELKPSARMYVREYSFFDNPSMPRRFASARNATRVDVNGGSAEMARLRALSGARVLHITNVPAIADELWRQQPNRGGSATGMFTDAEWRRFRTTFSNLQGGWCCAPRGSRPNAAGFHLMRAPPASRSEPNK